MIFANSNINCFVKSQRKAVACGGVFVRRGDRALRVLLTRGSVRFVLGRWLRYPWL